ncbi:hypothetical protein [Aeromicrobium sp.]|uniref:hypothetical protein n=1 Tax=Aeromicrobium sp. TaxID=1871063 RepID=UPI0035168743
MAADFKALSKFDQGALVAGAVAILFSFFDAFVTASVKGSGDFAVNTSAGRNAWYSFATLGILLVIVTVAVVALTVFTALSFKDSGEKLPEVNKKSDPPAAS